MPPKPDMLCARLYKRLQILYEKGADKELSDNCGVCERHFEERFIEKSWQHVIGAEVVHVARDRPSLTDDAVPTVFPDAPKYFTKRAPVKRKNKSL